MRIDKDIYEKIKKEVENDLKNYPYYLISIETLEYNFSRQR